MFYIDYYHFGKEVGNSYNYNISDQNYSTSEILSLISTDNAYNKYLKYLLEREYKF